MKSFVAGLILALSLGLALAAPPQSATDITEDQAIQECNATNPVQRNPRTVIGLAVVSGERIKISEEEKCFLLCFLQKVKFLDENANIRNGAGVVNYTMHEVPELGKYVDVLIASVFQMNRSTKQFDDKCQKAFLKYHQFSQMVFTLAVADGLNSATDVKEKIVNAIENGQSVDQDISKHIKQFLERFNKVMTSLAKRAGKKAQA